jgi:hypothetical protein
VRVIEDFLASPERLVPREENRTDMGTKTRIRAQASSGNVFADLGLPNPEQELLKARLAL